MVNIVETMICGHRYHLYEIYVNQHDWDLDLHQKVENSGWPGILCGWTFIIYSSFQETRKYHYHNIEWVWFYSLLNSRLGHIEIQWFRSCDRITKHHRRKLKQSWCKTSFIIFERWREKRVENKLNKQVILHSKSWRRIKVKAESIDYSIHA